MRLPNQSVCVLKAASSSRLSLINVCALQFNAGLSSSLDRSVSAAGNIKLDISASLLNLI